MVLNVFSILADIAVVITLVIALAQFKKDQQKREEDVRHDRKAATLNAYNCLQREALDKLYIDFKPSQIAEIAEHPKKSENEYDYHKLGTYLARIEHFCVGVNTDIYDKEIVYELAHGFLDGTIRERIKPLIEKKTAYAGFDPYANIRKVYEMMDNETEKRKVNDGSIQM